MYMNLLGSFNTYTEATEIFSVVVNRHFERDY